jgi:hypothetical protein
LRKRRDLPSLLTSLSLSYLFHLSHSCDFITVLQPTATGASTLCIQQASILTHLLNSESSLTIMLGGLSTDNSSYSSVYYRLVFIVVSILISLCFDLLYRITFRCKERNYDSLNKKIVFISIDTTYLKLFLYFTCIISKYFLCTYPSQSTSPQSDKMIRNEKQDTGKRKAYENNCTRFGFALHLAYLRICCTLQSTRYFPTGPQNVE